MNIPHRVVICLLLACQILLFIGLISIRYAKSTKDSNATDSTNEHIDAELSKEQPVLDLQMKSLFFLLTISFLLFLTSIIAFIMDPNLRLLYFIITGTVASLVLQVAAILVITECFLILMTCAASTALVLISFNTILSNLLYQSALDAYPSSRVNHRFSNCELQDLSTFRRYTLDPTLAREQIMMHQARSNNRKSFLFVIPSDDPTSSYANPASDFVDC